MKKQPSISVAMTTFNGEKYLRPQLDSILQQTYPPQEIVICDDGSTDGTLSILQEYRAKHPELFCIHINSHNLGFVKNFEQAIALCQGDIIALSDQDDVWLPGKLERFLHSFTAHPQVGMACCEAMLVDAESNPFGELLYTNRFRINGRPEQTLPNLLRKVDVKGCTLAFRTEFRPLLLPFPPAGWGHDHWIVFILAVLSEVQFLPEPLMMYRRHDQNYGFDPAHKGIRYYIKWRRLTFSRWAYEEDYRKWQAVLDHLERIAGDEDAPKQAIKYGITMVRRRFEFAQKRLALRNVNRLFRLYPLLELYASGSHFAYGRGLRTFIRDAIA